jgi:AraC-like DNA-binding protein
VHPGPPEYVAGRPHPALAGLVLRCTGYRESAAAPVRRRQAPHGGCTLVVGLEPALRLHGPAGPVVGRSFLAGMHDRAVVTEFIGAQEGVQVDLAPLGVHVLLGRPVADLTDRCPPLDALGVPALAALPARVAAADGWAARFAAVDDALLGLLAAARTRPDPEVVAAWRRLVRSGGSTPVGELAREVGWSRRHLLTRFTAQVGLGPKTAARVLRFRRAAQLLVPVAPDGGPVAPVRRSIADVAADCGYADQAHLAREFRDLAGCPPSTYAAQWAAAADPFKAAGAQRATVGP